MLKADRYYIDNLTAIRDNGSIDVNPRPKYADGVAAHTKYFKRRKKNSREPFSRINACGLTTYG